MFPINSIPLASATPTSYTTPTPTASQAQMVEDASLRNALSRMLARYSLSIVLPAYNEEQVILTTLSEVVSALTGWDANFEVIVVNDGSADATGELVASLAAHDPHVRLIAHATNLGYGAALISGFTAARNDLTFFMDADGQFTICDLPRLLARIEGVDAVLGYRIQRQDSWLRSLNARGWQALIAMTLGVQVRDLDCAFKLIRSDYLRAHPPTTGSALINAELVYTLQRSGARYCEVGVRHLPRLGGRATGAHPRVVVRALLDLLRNGRRWRQSEYTTVPFRDPHPHTSHSPTTNHSQPLKGL